MKALEDKIVDDLAELYRSGMTRLLDQHCPVVQVRHKVKQTPPWYDADCHAACRRVRAAERRFRRTGAEADRRAWEDKMKVMRMLYEAKNSSYCRDEIAASKGNARRLWRTFHDILGEESRDETGCHSADDTASFFKDKVNGVRASTASTPVYDVPYRATPTLENWTAVTAEGIQNCTTLFQCKESRPYHEELRLKTSFYPILSALAALFLHCSPMVTLTSLPTLSLQYTEVELYYGRRRIKWDSIADYLQYGGAIVVRHTPCRRAASQLSMISMHFHLQSGPDAIIQIHMNLNSKF